MEEDMTRDVVFVEDQACLLLVRYVEEQEWFGQSVFIVVVLVYKSMQNVLAAKDH